MKELKELREVKGMTQDELADRLGVTQGAISQWENGTAKPSFDNIKKLASVLDVTIDKLMGEK